jgi:uncharacterized C2H2 Zn-finger protein
MKALTRADVIKKVRQQPGFTLAPRCPECGELHEAKDFDRHLAGHTNAEPRSSAPVGGTARGIPPAA